MEPSAEEINNTIICYSCSQPLREGAHYCTFCGAAQSHLDVEDAEQKQKVLISLTVFFGIFLLVCLVSNLTGYMHGLIPLLVADGILSVVTIIYTFIYWKEIRPLLRWKNFTIVKAAGYSSLAIAAAAVVSWLVRWLNKTIFDTETYYYFAFSHLKYAKLVTLLMVALQPALVEELAFRGVMQEGFNKVTEQQQAIFISAFLFALLHMSIISFFWLLPFAFWLGYVREKEQTLWYGMLIHFCFNSTACFLEFFALHLF